MFYVPQLSPFFAKKKSFLFKCFFLFLDNLRFALHRFLTIKKLRTRNSVTLQPIHHLLINKVNIITLNWSICVEKEFCFLPIIVVETMLSACSMGRSVRTGCLYATATKNKHTLLDNYLLSARTYNHICPVQDTRKKLKNRCLFPLHHLFFFISEKMRSANEFKDPPCILYECLNI